MILIEKDGERQLVESIDGYDGWSIIAKDVEAPLSEHSTFTNGAWVEDEEAKAVADRKAALNALTREELVTMIEAKIDERVSIVQAQVEAVAAATAVPMDVLTTAAEGAASSLGVV